MTTADVDRKSSLMMIVIAWTLVLVPLGWGVYQSVVKSLPLFRGIVR